MSTIDLEAMSEAELVELNRRVVERIRHLRDRQTREGLLAFEPGQRVCFDRTDGGGVVYGRVLRVNRKTVTIEPEDDPAGQWRVSPQVLRPAGENEVPVTRRALASDASDSAPSVSPSTPTPTPTSPSAPGTTLKGLREMFEGAIQEAGMGDELEKARAGGPESILRLLNGLPVTDDPAGEASPPSPPRPSSPATGSGQGKRKWKKRKRK